MTDPLGQSQVLPYLIGLSKSGFEFHIISFEKPERLKANRKQIKAICDQHGISWHPQDYSYGGIKRTIRQVRVMLKVADYLFKRHQFDIIHCRSYISALAGQRLKKKYKVPFVFDMRGFWADERVDGKLWNLKHPIYRIIYQFFKKKEKEFLKEADAIVSLTEAGLMEMKTWQIRDIEKKTTIIPCCVDVAHFSPSTNADKATSLKKRLKIDPEAKVLGYVGSIGTWYMLDEMLDFYLVFRQQNPKSVFLFISGESRENILTRSNDKGIPAEEIMVESVPHQQVADHLSMFDLSVFFILPSFSKKASSPTKQGELMSMGIPIICNGGVGDTAELIQKYRAGAIVDEFSSASYQRAINDLVRYDREEARKGAQEYFALEEGVRRYLRIYSKLIG